MNWESPLLYSQAGPQLVLVIYCRRNIALVALLYQDVVKLDGVLFWQALAFLDLQNHVMLR